MNDEAIRKATAAALKAMRTKRGLTQQQVAEATGLTQSVLSRWESGAVTPNTYAYHALAKAYDVEPAALMASHHDVERARALIRGPRREQDK
jgi:transcriptional regulator with XRE-family HTH domain